MTREEFIDGYIKRSGLEEYRTPDGYEIEGHRQIAMECACGSDRCEGWAMVSANDVETHVGLYAPQHMRVGMEEFVPVHADQIGKPGFVRLPEGCENCKGSGLVTCRNCDGARWGCERCDQGEVKCEECNGNGVADPAGLGKEVIGK